MNKRNWLLIAGVVAIAGLVSLVALDRRARALVVEFWATKVGPHSTTEEHRQPATWPPPKPHAWDGLVTISDQQRDVIGVRTVAVKLQTEPMVLRLAGATDYDPATLTVVRVQFDSRVDRVLVDLGSVVKKGDPLINLFSNTLAEAKSVYETAYNQWRRDKKVLDYKAPLAKSGTIPPKELIDAENDEAKSREAMKLAEDKLAVFGLTDAEIEGAKSEEGVSKARMVIRAITDGIVIKRNVVPGNFYDPHDDLMTIAPLDRLWVRGVVSEIDADKVQKDQSLRVVFPYSGKTVRAKVEYIDKAIDPDTRAAKFRTSIPNPDRLLKAGAYVRVLVDVPPGPGDVVIPREAMVSVDEEEFVFVRKEGAANRFERRRIVVIKETNDWVVVSEPTAENPGLRPGENVVTTGSLLLEQMYETQVMLETGTLL